MTPSVDAPAAAMILESLSLGFGAQQLLHDASFAVPSRGITAIVGPAGVGKSTVLRTLARRAEQLPSFWHRGRVLVDGQDLLSEWDLDEARRSVALIAQKARLFTASVADNLLASASGVQMTLAEKRDRAETLLMSSGLYAELVDRLSEPAIALPLGLQRRLSLARIAAANPTAILVDEPTRDIADDEAARLTSMLCAEARHRAVLLVTHDQALAKRVAERIILFVSGHIVADCKCDDFFEAPPNAIAEKYVRTGSCWPSEGELSDALSPDVAPSPVCVEPSGFRWHVGRQLAGMARPGLLAAEVDDLAALRALGIDVLVCLEETWVSAGRLDEFGIVGEHVPIPDMDAPTIDQAIALCERTWFHIARGRTPAYHCKAGLGRTGTMLAAYLIYSGMASVRALEEVRAASRLYVQSEVQVEFLHEFERYCRDRQIVPPTRKTFPGDSP
jgi:atypical dual specificity phosphatase